MLAFRLLHSFTSLDRAFGGREISLLQRGISVPVAGPLMSESSHHGVGHLVVARDLLSAVLRKRRSNEASVSLPWPPGRRNLGFWPMSGSATSSRGVCDLDC
jgi:hypothetical protein